MEGRVVALNDLRCPESRPLTGVHSVSYGDGDAIIIIGGDHNSIGDSGGSISNGSRGGDGS